VSTHLKMSQKRQRLSTSRSRCQASTSRDELATPQSSSRNSEPKTPDCDPDQYDTSEDDEDDFVDTCTFQNAVRDGVLCSLVLSEQKFPFKRADLFQKYSLKGKKATIAFKRVNAYLNEIYGLGLFNIGDQKYILSSTIDFKCPDSLKKKKKKPDSMTVLKLILCALYIQGMKADEDTILGFLNRLKVVESINCGGSLKKLLHDFERQGYLTKTVDNNLTTKNVVYGWGPRSDLEFKAEDIERFINKVQKKNGAAAADKE